MIQLKQVSVGDSDALLLSELSLSIESGDTIALYGPSGGGKSTLLKMLLGGYRWSSGDYIFMQQSVNERNIQKLRQTIAYIPQLPELGNGRVLDYLKEPFSWQGFRKQRFDYEKMLGWLDRLELKERQVNQTSTQLSGGQRQRFAIVRALMTDRKVIVADEPTSALDQSSANAVRSVLLSEDYTLISASHDQRWIDLCNRKIKIASGKIVEESRPCLQAALL